VGAPATLPRGAAPTGIAPRWLLWSGCAVVAAGAALSADTGRSEPFVVGAGLAAGAAIVYIALASDPAWPLSLGLAAAVFSGNSEHMGLPIGPDRLLIGAGLVAVVLRRWSAAADGERIEPLEITPVHWVMLAAGLWAIGSAYWAGTLTNTDGLFPLLDKFGLVPFAMFLAAPLVFRTEQQRRILLGTLVVTGAYLGLTAVFEKLGPGALVFPKYIDDPSVGIHFGRARGPFVEAVANGLALAGCGAAALMASRVWRGTVRLACYAVALLCVLGMLLTLTRGVWVAGVAAAVVTGLLVPELRRWLVPGIAMAAVIVAGALLLVPGLSDQVSARRSEKGPIWVRENTNRAALNMVDERPITGFGWARFGEESPPYFEQAASRPLNGVGEGVHNVLLSNAVELGLVGTALWLAGWLLGIGGALLRRPPPALRIWRIGLGAYVIAWVVVAAVGPLPYAFPTLLIWTWAGVLSSGDADSRRVRSHVDGPRPAAMRP
jgi:putative inorganic carbon (hco3(-)) transporter